MVPMIHAPHIIKLRRTRSKFLRRRLNASKGSLTAHLGAALSGGTLDSVDFFWLGYFDYPISSGIMESINNFGTPTRMADGYRDVDYLHLRTTPSMSQKAYSLAPRPRLGSAHLRHHARLHGHLPAPRRRHHLEVSRHLPRGGRPSRPVERGRQHRCGWLNPNPGAGASSPRFIFSEPSY